MCVNCSTYMYIMLALYVYIHTNRTERSVAVFYHRDSHSNMHRIAARARASHIGIGKCVCEMIACCVQAPSGASIRAVYQRIFYRMEVTTYMMAVSMMMVMMTKFSRFRNGYIHTHTREKCVCASTCGMCLCTYVLYCTAYTRRVNIQYPTTSCFLLFWWELLLKISHSQTCRVIINISFTYVFVYTTCLLSESVDAFAGRQNYKQFAIPHKHYTPCN